MNTNALISLMIAKVMLFANENDKITVLSTLIDLQVLVKKKKDD